MVHDTLLQVQNAGLNVRKPLKVQFFGEEGVDEGGVQKVTLSTLCTGFSARLWTPGQHPALAGTDGCLCSTALRAPGRHGSLCQIA